MKKCQNNRLLVRNNQRGATLVEFSIVAWVFFLLIFGALDLFLYSYNTLSARYLVNDFLRTAVTGNARANGDVAEQDPNSRAISVRDALKNKAKAFGLNLEDSNIEICYETTDAQGNRSCGSQFEAGNRNSLIVVRINYQFQSLFQGWSYPVNITTVGRNEPF